MHRIEAMGAVGVICCIVAAAGAQTLPNGVAAGDVDQESAVLWARSTAVGPIEFAVIADTDALGILYAAEVRDPDVPVKLEIPVTEDTVYSYTVRDAAGAEAEGTFYAPASQGYHGLRFGVSGDWRGELAPYPSVANVPERELDLFVALGDTIYADDPSIDFPGPQARTVEDFRIKHNEVYSARFEGNFLTELRASTTILACVDDHEVTNDFSGGAPPSTDSRFDATGDYVNETQLWSNGMQVFQEYNPVRDEFYGETGDPRTAGKRKLYRFRRYGDDAAIMLLDARSFRDQGLPELIEPPGPAGFREYQRASFDPSRTMLGAAQLDDLMNDLLLAEEEGITWKFVLVPEPIQNLGPILASDRFEGYAAERSAILSFIEENEVHNVVFVAADIHGTIVNNLTYQRRAGGRQIPTSTFEITTGSVAYAAPFGPTTVEFAPDAIRNLYQRLDRDGQNDLIRTVADTMLGLYGYPRIGLQRSPIDARLLEGGYVAVNTYGWTEFEIDARSQCLTVTTYGIYWYDEEELFADPDEVLARTPQVVSRFRVEPRGLPRDSQVAEHANCNVKTNACGALGPAGVAALSATLTGLGCAPRNRPGRVRPLP